MTIILMSDEDFDRIMEIFTKYPALTYQNKDYDTLDKSKLTQEELNAFNEVDALLEKTIQGFHYFKNFKISIKTGEPQIRFQYNWCADEEPKSNLGQFSGVGYLFIDELKNGFRKN